MRVGDWGLFFLEGKSSQYQRTFQLRLHLYLVAHSRGFPGLTLLVDRFDQWQRQLIKSDVGFSPGFRGHRLER